MTLTDIVTSIDQRLAQANAEISRLDDARHALVNTPAPVGTRKPRRAARKRTPVADAIVSAEKLTSVLNGSPGMSTRDLAQATNGRPDQILARLRELENDNQIRRTGHRRGTRWHVITDEDRVAARAAEIAAEANRRRGNSTN